jgi:hypothetical protein
MKVVTLSAREFENFKKLANHLHILFTYTISHGTILVEAKTYELEGLGY